MSERSAPFTDPTDPIKGLWLAALRAQIDAVVLQFEAQLKAHVAATTAAERRERGELEAQRDALATRLSAVTASLRGTEAERDALRSANATLYEERDTLRTSLDYEKAERLRLDARLAVVGAEYQRLDEQFAAERSFVDAANEAAGSSLVAAIGDALGTAVEASPECFAALKAKRPDAVLAQGLRDRGRSVLRDPITAMELHALGAMSLAAGCTLVEVSVGQRYSAATMEKVSTRSEPADEGLVLECSAPGLRLAGSAGALVFPKVVVATG